MKRVLVICDGMADIPVSGLDGKTPLEAAYTPTMDFMAKHGRCGSLKTVPEGYYPGSEVAILTILGYSPEELPSGRGPLEAEGLGLKASHQQIVCRYELRDASYSVATLEKKYPSYIFRPISVTTGICILPPAFGQPPENEESIRFWSGDHSRKYISFSNKHHGFGITAPAKTVLIGSVPLICGIAKATGMDWIKPERATGDCNTDYAGKGDAAIAALLRYDVIIVHVEACDYASHKMDCMAKVQAIENIDRYIISPLIELLNNGGHQFSIAVMSDHPSLCEQGHHSNAPSPFLYYYPGISPDEVSMFSEKEVVKGSLIKIADIYE